MSVALRHGDHQKQPPHRTAFQAGRRGQALLSAHLTVSPASQRMRGSQILRLLSQVSDSAISARPRNRHDLITSVGVRAEQWQGRGAESQWQVSDGSGPAAGCVQAGTGKVVASAHLHGISAVWHGSTAPPPASPPEGFWVSLSIWAVDRLPPRSKRSTCAACRGARTAEAGMFSMHHACKHAVLAQLLRQPRQTVWGGWLSSARTLPFEI